MNRPSIFSAEFNIREICKQMLLLEDHLSDDDKYCTDCIRKHLMTVEALAEEAVTLEPKSKWLKHSKRIALKARNWMIAFTDGMDKYTLSQYIRRERKVLLKMVHDPRVKK